MPKKVIVTEKAQLLILQVVTFWNEHNQSATYSRKLLKEIRKQTRYISTFPFSFPIFFENDYRRVLILNHFSLIYKVLDDEIYIVSFWDNRRNPEDLKL